MSHKNHIRCAVASEGSCWAAAFFSAAGGVSDAGFASTAVAGGAGGTSPGVTR